MTEATASSMRDARDAEDSRLLAEGEIDLLLSAYVDVVRGRCIARLRDGLAGEDAAQVVFLRLWKELKHGKHADGRLPFRVIVHKVIDFTCKGWFEPGWIETGWLDLDEPTPDETAAVDARLDLEAFIETLPPGDRRVAELYWLLGRSAAQIAVELGKQPNAIHQATFRNTKKLAAWLVTTS